MKQNIVHMDYLGYDGIPIFPGIRSKKLFNHKQLIYSDIPPGVKLSYEWSGLTIFVDVVRSYYYTVFVDSV